MNKEKLSFTKTLNFVNPYYSLHNRCNYNIFEENSINSKLKVMSSLTSELHMDSRIYHIKPITRFFTVKGFEILLNSNQIGRIEYWGWTWKKPKLIIKTQGYDQVWTFERKEPRLFRNRTNHYTTKLKHQDREVVYEIELDKSINIKENLSELKGVAYFDEDDRLPCHLGIYFNELLIFDEIDK